MVEARREFVAFMIPTPFIVSAVGRMQTKLQRHFDDNLVTSPCLSANLKELWHFS